MPRRSTGVGGGLSIRVKTSSILVRGARRLRPGVGIPSGAGLAIQWGLIVFGEKCSKGGESALQADCGRFDSVSLHHLLIELLR